MTTRNKQPIPEGMPAPVGDLQNLIIADKDNSLDAAVRFFNAKGEQTYYASTRLGTLKRVEGGYLVENVDEYTGMNYELKKIDSGQVLKGTVSNFDQIKVSEITN